MKAKSIKTNYIATRQVVGAARIVHGDWVTMFTNKIMIRFYERLDKKSE